MMKAAVLEAFGQPLVLKDVPVPEPGPGEILVRIEASGVCNADLDAQAGIWTPAARPRLPRILGHKGVGVVERVGPGVTRVKPGGRVGVPLVSGSCGQCEYCFDGWQRLCQEVAISGVHVDGCHARYVRADARYVGIVPDGLDVAQAAHLTCTGITALGAIKAADLQPGNWCAVLGLGAVGQYTVQFARAIGVRVVAVSSRSQALDSAKRGGAEITIDGTANDPAKLIRGQIGGVHAAICTGIEPAGFVQGFRSLRRRGTLVAVGLPMADLPIPIFTMIMKAVTVRGSFVGSRADLEDAYAIALRNGIHMDTEDAPLDSVNEVYRRIREGSMSSRAVLTP